MSLPRRKTGSRGATGRPAAGRSHIDVAALKARVGDGWLDLLRTLAPELEEACDEFPEHVPCPIHGGSDGFRLFDNAEETGGGVCNTCGTFSDGIALLQKLKDWSFATTLRRMKEYLGDDGEEVEESSPAAPQRRRRLPEANREAALCIEEAMERAEAGHERLRAYNRCRGLGLEPSENLGYVEQEPYYDSETGSQNLPAMLAVFQDVKGEPVALFRTYLDPEGDGKARVSAPKKCTTPVRKGATMGAAIRLWEAGTILGIAEGIETAEAVFEGTGTPTWATCAANRLEKFQVPAGVSEVQVWGDNDTSGAGQRAAKNLAERLAGEGIRVKLILPPEADKDWLDVLVEKGPEALRRALAAAPFLDPPASALRNGDPVAVINRDRFLVPFGGKTYVATEKVDPVTGHHDIALGSYNDFALLFANWLVPVDKDREIPAAQLWLTSPERREYKGIVFAPGKDVPGYYNLWRGFAVEPRPGDCSLFWAHVKEVICRGVEEHFRYVTRWLAHLVQKPNVLPGVALVILGSQGTGKTFFADLIGALFGQHYLMLTRMEQLTGKFTGHLAYAIVVCANEAIWGGDKQGEGALKSLITDPLCTVEPKGKDLYQVNNYKRLIVTSNENWAVPMAMDDRRFLVLEASDARLLDRRYFEALDRQMRTEGGLQALLHELLSMDLSGFDVRTKPASSHGFDIQLRSAEPIVRWWFEQLYNGELTWFRDSLEDHTWDLTPKKEDLHRSFLEFCEGHRLRGCDKALFCKGLHKLLPGLRLVETKVRNGERRMPCFKLPSLQKCREAFQRYAKAGADIWADGSVVEEEAE